MSCVHHEDECEHLLHVMVNLPGHKVNTIRVWLPKESSTSVVERCIRRAMHLRYAGKRIIGDIKLAWTDEIEEKVCRGSLRLQLVENCVLTATVSTSPLDAVENCSTPSFVC
jgi:hypothetical protein